MPARQEGDSFDLECIAIKACANEPLVQAPCSGCPSGGLYAAKRCCVDGGMLREEASSLAAVFRMCDPCDVGRIVG